MVETYLVISGKSEIIFLDEPFTHLSPLNIEKFKELLQKEKQHKAIVLTDHMYRHVLDLTTHIYLLTNNCSKLIGKKEELEDYRYLSRGSL
ncbi:hypothetical protein [Zunongwangia sp. H14]|uniref:hypothetical protein n=1 Tax=Zunongwangia sp. H14 TaxID=3240792 RepID=UPI003567A499